MGAHPRCNKMTTHRYRIPNKREIIAMWAKATSEPDSTAKTGIPRMINPAAQPAVRDARTYFHTAPSTGAIPKPIGLPAYQKAGIVRIQKDAVQAAATPTGPHGNARRNSRPVTAISTKAQRIQRSALPMERWIQPWI